MSLDNEIDELFKKLNDKKEMIDRMEEGKEKEREKRILEERLVYFCKNIFLQNINHVHML